MSMPAFAEGSIRLILLFTESDQPAAVPILVDVAAYFTFRYEQFKTDEQRVVKTVYQLIHVTTKTEDVVPVYACIKNAPS